jgi:hypothetical protein
VITEAVSKEVAATVEGPGLLEHWQHRDSGSLSRSWRSCRQHFEQAAQQEAQAAQQAAQHKAAIHHWQLKAEVGEVKAKMATMKQQAALASTPEVAAAGGL